MNQHLVINYIILENHEIIVGATDSERWAWDTEDGYSGADARTMIWVTLSGKRGEHTQEKVEFYCPIGDPLRPLAMQHVGDLLAIAWAIKNEGLTEEQAREKYFGYEIIHP
jgi:hypothetical protein